MHSSDQRPAYGATFVHVDEPAFADPDFHIHCESFLDGRNAIVRTYGHTHPDPDGYRFADPDENVTTVSIPDTR